MGITRRETFATLKDWVRELRTQGPSNILIAVVGNKADLVENRQVEESAGQEFAKEINLHLYQEHRKVVVNARLYKHTRSKANGFNLDPQIGSDRPWLVGRRCIDNIAILSRVDAHIYEYETTSKSNY